MADLNPRKVLVIDNDSDSIEPLERTLRDHGLQPVIVRRADVALKRIKDEKPGAVIIELALPDRDGRSVIKEIKDDWEAKKTPIVVLSNYPNRLDSRSRDNVEAVLGKPANWQEVVAQVQRAIQKGQSS